MVGGEATGPWGGGTIISTGGAPPLPAVSSTVDERDQELENLRASLAHAHEQLRSASRREMELGLRVRRSEAAASRAADLLRELAPVLHSTIRAVAAATVDAQLHAAEDAGELPF